MKKYLFLCIAVVSLALSPWQAYAQRYLPKMMGVELRGGFVNGSKSPLNYYTGIAMSGYTKKANRWVAGAEYLLKNYDYRGTSVPRAQFTAEGGYYLKFLSDPTKTFFLSIGGFQRSFIEREGHLEQQESKWVLTVENKAYDILLDSLPWSYKMIRLPWLKKPISVSWRDKEEFDFDSINR